MSNIASLDEVLKGVPTEELKEEAVSQTPEVKVDEKPIAKEGEEIIETEDGYRRVKKEEISSSENAAELHSSTPESSLDNLAKLSSEMDEKVERAKEIAEEREKQEALEKSLNEERESKFKDVVVEVPEEVTTALHPMEDKEKAAKEAEEAKALSEIKILKFKKDDQKKKQYDRILEKRKKVHNEEAQQSVLINSGYTSKYSGLLSPEMIAIRNNQENSDEFSATKYMYEKLYEHQVESSVGSMTWDQWLKGTSLLELNTIFFALFCSTYPDVNEYPGICTDAKCNEKFMGKPFTFTYPNKSLMYLDEKDREEVSKEILHLIHTKEPIEDFKNSNVHYVVRKKLSTGTIVDFRHPSLYNHLTDTLENLNKSGLLQQTDSDLTALFNILPYVENIFVYDKDLDGYIELDAFIEKLTELQYLNDDDLAICGKIVEEIQNEYKIKFGFRNLKCPRCGKALPNQPIPNVAELLFLVQMMKATKGNI